MRRKRLKTCAGANMIRPKGRVMFLERAGDTRLYRVYVSPSVRDMMDTSKAVRSWSWPSISLV